MKKIIIPVIVVVVLITAGVVFVQYRKSQTAYNAGSRSGQQGNNKGQSGQKAQEKSADEVSGLAFDVKNQEIGKESTFSLKAMIDPKGKKLSAAELHVVFDPKMLKLESVEPSEIFSLVLMSAQIDNEKGTAAIVFGVPLGGKAVESSAQIASFNFRSLSTSGKTEVNFTDKSVAAALETEGNVVSTRTGATISVQ